MNEESSIGKFYRPLRLADLAKAAVKGIGGVTIVYLLSGYVGGKLPEFASDVNLWALVLYIGLSAYLLVGFFQQQKEYSDPNLYFQTKRNYEYARGAELNNESKSIFNEIMKKTPMTMEQAVRYFQLATQDNLESRVVIPKEERSND